MGSTSYSGMSSVTRSSYDELASKRKATTGVTAFSHTSAIRSGKTAAKVHTRVDPASIATSVTGKRESRDPDGVNNSNPIAVFFDVTGSMHSIPVTLQTKLNELMQTVLTKGVIDDPQILFGAIGDATCDRVPFQVGQFESDLAMDEDLDKFFLEGGGGGQCTESYELGLFFLGHLTSTDAFEKRGKRGYAFLIGDEMAYNSVKKREVDRVFGDTIGIQEDIPIQEALKKAQEMYEVFFIIPTDAWHGQDPHIREFWQKLLGQNVLLLDDANLVCETIVTTIGLSEGTIEDANDVADSLGISTEDANTVNKALTEYIGSGKLATVDGGTLATSTEDGLDS